MIEHEAASGGALDKLFDAVKPQEDRLSVSMGMMRPWIRRELPNSL
jgi:hypothetical protein